ncbi:MAG: phytanoyl-CoA dioxygenase family protein [Pseudomonadota bacterium]
MNRTQSPSQNEPQNHSQKLSQRFESEGYLCPIPVFDADQALALRKQLESIEHASKGDDKKQAAFCNNAHFALPMFDAIARDPGILDAVEAVLGHNILALHVDIFIKEAGSPKFISWHQDLHYWGLDSDNEVTAWLALSPATKESGCMRFIPGSHKRKYEHRDTFAGDNMLTRGQEAVGVSEEDAIFAELQPGEMSLHHGKLLHASTANTSSDRRIGVAIRYITPSMSLASGTAQMGAMLVRGEDRFGHFELLESPASDFEPKAMANWQRLREVEEQILFAGANPEAA